MSSRNHVENKEGIFDWSGSRNLRKFLEICKEENMLSGTQNQAFVMEKCAMEAFLIGFSPKV